MKKIGEILFAVIFTIICFIVSYAQGAIWPKLCASTLTPFGLGPVGFVLGAITSFCIGFAIGWYLIGPCWTYVLRKQR